MSHAPADVRQMTAEDMKASFGQVLLTPLQLSATSQAPAEDRQTAVLLASAGQSLPTPSQTSARSQAPADARHCAVLLASAGHAPFDPVHVSVVSIKWS